jgi:hypothetical protein
LFICLKDMLCTIKSKEDCSTQFETKLFPQFRVASVIQVNQKQSDKINGQTG